MELRKTGEGRKAEDKVPTVSAGGVPDGEPKHWYVAIVKRNSEKVCREALTANGYKAYVATQTIVRSYAKRKPKPVEQVVIPSKVFIQLPHFTPAERTQFFCLHPFITNFMYDVARERTSYGMAKLAAIPDFEIQRLRQMLSDTEHPVAFGELNATYAVGTRVRVTHGPMSGYEGVIAQRKGKSYFAMQTQYLNCAFVQIPFEYFEPIDTK